MLFIYCSPVTALRNIAYKIMYFENLNENGLLRKSYRIYPKIKLHHLKVFQVGRKCSKYQVNILSRFFNNHHRKS